MIALPVGDRSVGNERAGCNSRIVDNVAFPRALGIQCGAGTRSSIAYETCLLVNHRDAEVMRIKRVSIADSNVFYFSGKIAFLSENIETKYLRVIVNAFSSAL